MDPFSTELFSVALGLAKPWSVARVEFSEQDQQRDLWLDFPAGSTFGCPECSQAGCKVHDTSERTWRHLDFFQHKTFLSPNTHKRPRPNTSKAATPGANVVTLHAPTACFKGRNAAGHDSIS